jgi:hypothetical protein
MADLSTQKPNGFKTALDTIIAPKEAFESLSVAPTWFWALAISILVTCICSYLTVPALIHATTADWPNQIAKNPGLAGMSAERQQAALDLALKIDGFVWMGFIFFIPVGNLIAAVIMSIFNALGRGQGSFGKYWASACNIGFISWAVGSILLAAIVLIRGADSFNSSLAVQSAVPSLGMIASPDNHKLLALLATITPISLWAAFLNAMAMSVIGRVPQLQAWLTAIILLLLPGLFGAAFAQ